MDGEQRSFKRSPRVRTSTWPTSAIRRGGCRGCEFAPLSSAFRRSLTPSSNLLSPPSQAAILYRLGVLFVPPTLLFFSLALPPCSSRLSDTSLPLSHFARSSPGMNRDPTVVGRAKVGAETFAGVVNSFVDPISWKTMVGLRLPPLYPPVSPFLPPLFRSLYLFLSCFDLLNLFPQKNFQSFTLTTLTFLTIVLNSALSFYRSSHRPPHLSHSPTHQHQHHQHLPWQQQQYPGLPPPSSSEYGNGGGGGRYYEGMPRGWGAPEGPGEGAKRLGEGGEGEKEKGKGKKGWF